MKYLITLEVNDDPEGAMGDSPPLADMRGWQRYLDIDDDADVMRVVKVEIA